LYLGEVLELYRAPIGTSGVRESCEFIELKENYGVINDKFAGDPKRAHRSVMIVGKKPYLMAKEADIVLPQTALGENILLSFDPHTLPIGSQLQIGEALLEITAACTLCNHLTQYGKDLPKLILKHRGVYCKVIKSGIIRKSDSVITIKEESA